MKKLFFVFTILIMTTRSKAQSTVAGEYYLSGVMETASVFLLRPDSTFEFFFSYGALDRGGSGTWRQKGNEIMFDSKPQPLHDFVLVSSKKISGDSVTIKIVDENSFLVKYVYGKTLFEGNEIEEMANEEGEIKFPAQAVKSVSLVFGFCPEKASIFDLDKDHNYFEFRFEPWITEFFFKDFRLQRGGKDLTGKHPLLDDKEYHFEKRK